MNQRLLRAASASLGLAGLAADEPHMDAVYWGSLAMELAAGPGALVASRD